MPDVLPFKVSKPTALGIIRAAVAAERVGLLPHARQQMRKRRISTEQVLTCLEKGTMTEGPYLDIKGYWRCTMERLVAGDELVVVVSFNSRDHVLVVTAI